MPKCMKILLDTNIIIDCIANREPDNENSMRLFKCCEDGFFEGFVTTQSLADAFYSLRKDYPAWKRKELLYGVCLVLDIPAITQHHAIAALTDNKFPDFEDGMIAKCAEENECDYIITRDTKDFAASRIPVVTPREFLDKMRV